MKTELFIFIFVGLISLTSASTVYAGECLSVNLTELGDLENVFYLVVGNSSNLEGLAILLNGTEAEICPVANFAPDNFTLVFFNNYTQEKEVVYVRGHSHTHTITKTVNNTIVKEIPIYIAEENKTCQECLENKTIEIKPIETNKIPPWVWWIIVLEAIIIIIALIILSKKDKKEMKGGSEDGRNRKERKTKIPKEKS